MQNYCLPEKPTVIGSSHLYVFIVVLFLLAYLVSSDLHLLKSLCYLNSPSSCFSGLQLHVFVFCCSVSCCVDSPSFCFSGLVLVSLLFLLKVSYCLTSSSSYSLTSSPHAQSMHLLLKISCCSASSKCCLCDLFLFLFWAIGKSVWIKLSNDPKSWFKLM